MTKSGERHRSQVAYHKGHYKNPMSDAAVEAKLRSLVEGLVLPLLATRLLERLWQLEEVQDIGALLHVTSI